jgi:acetyl-CoA C-acetyltransferase
VTAVELGAHATRAALARAGVAPEAVDEFVIGCVGQVGPDAFIARRIALAAGAREDSGALAVNRLCGSGLQALMTAWDGLRAGRQRVVLAGGAENMSRQPFMDFDARSGWKLGHHELVDGTLSLVTDPWGSYPMGMTAEAVAEQFDVSRAEQDAFAAESQRRAAAALESEAVRGEIEPIKVKRGRETVMADTDQHPRPGVSVEKLAKMRPAFKTDGTVTAGNSSGINDAGAALVVTTASHAETTGQAPAGELVAFAVAGVAPQIMGYAPTYAIRRLLDQTGLAVGDLDWVELNEAFAAQAVAVIRDTGLEPDRTNPWGGAIAWGHPIGATGAILALRTLAGLKSQDGELGLVAMCIGGGQALAALFRRW